MSPDFFAVGLQLRNMKNDIPLDFDFVDCLAASKSDICSHSSFLAVGRDTAMMLEKLQYIDIIPCSVKPDYDVMEGKPLRRRISRESRV